MNIRNTTFLSNSTQASFFGLILIALFSIVANHVNAQATLPIGITQVSPPPGATAVSVDTAIEVEFAFPTQFQWTSNRLLKVRNLNTGTIAFQVDPESGDLQEGNSNYIVTFPPNTLLPETSYEVTLDYTFSRLNSPPWRTYPIEPGEWTFTTGTANETAQSIQVPGIVSVSPAPGSVGHPINAPLVINFQSPITFDFTEEASLILVDTSTGLVVNRIDPDEKSFQSGSTQFEVQLDDGTLAPDTLYEVRLSEGFARFNELPWRNGAIAAGTWQFTTGGIDFDPLPVSVSGIRGVYPRPGAINQSPEIIPHIQFTTPISFEWTEKRFFSIVDLSTGQVIYEVDPAGDNRDGSSDIIAIELPSDLLLPHKEYEIKLDPSFARIQESPWKSGGLSDQLWTFSTGDGRPHPLIGNSGITHLYPVPGATNVSTDVELALHFSSQTDFQGTEGNRVEILKSTSNELIYSLDPSEGDSQNGQYSYKLSIPPGNLQPETSYSIRIANRFAGLQQAPWWTAPITEDQWQFETGRGIPGKLTPEVEGITRVYPLPGTAVSRSPQTLSVYFTHRLSFAGTEGRFLTIRNTATDEILAQFDPGTDDSHTGLRHFSIPLPVEQFVENGRYEVRLDYGFVRFEESPWKTGEVGEESWIILTGTGEFADPVDPVDPDEPVDPVDPGLPVDDGDTPSLPVGLLPDFGIPTDCPCLHEGNGTLYHVGPGRAYETLGEVPWLTLTAGDTVMIEWRDTPYREKIGIQAQGTASQPVRVCGVRGPNGELPVIDGENAVTSPQFQNFFSYWQSGGQSFNDEYLAMIYIKRGSGQAWGNKPRYIEIFNLKLTGAHPDHTFTDAQGNTQSYVNGSAGIRGNLVENLTVKATEISGNGNGFFILSKDSEEEVSRDILFERNFVHSNGIIGDYLEHNIYTQADGITFQYNVIENPTPGMLGSSLKDRSVGTVIRYNWIQSGARLLDLVDPEDSFSVIGRESDTYVYGNILINDFDQTPHSINMIHFGGDTGNTAMYRQNLHFYHNTLVTINGMRDRGWRTTYFDLPTGDQTVYLTNNIFDRHGDAYLYLMRGGAGHAVLNGVNWFNADWAPAENSQYHPFSGTVTFNGIILAGAGSPLQDVYHYDFRLKPDSSAIDMAAPVAVPMEHQAAQEYAPFFGTQARTPVGVGLDIGAWEYRE